MSSKMGASHIRQHLERLAAIDSGKDHGKPAPPFDLSHLYSRLSLKIQGNSMKQFYKYSQVPGIGQIAGGLPNYEYFPLDTIEAQVAKVDRWTPSSSSAEDAALSASLSKASLAGKGSGGAEHMVVPKVDERTDPSGKIDLKSALQYGTAVGYPPLRSFVRDFTRNHLHRVPYLGGPEVLLDCGSNDGFSKVMQLLTDPWFPESDPLEARPAMLTEDYAYPTPLNVAQPRGVQVVAVAVDSKGMCAEGPRGLRDILENWDYHKGRRPHFMYTVTMGHNPLGSVLPAERREEIYKLCCQYDVIIVEDDPYWCLQYQDVEESEARSRGLPFTPSKGPQEPPQKTGYKFLDSLESSFLEYDTQGRVIRLDTFSKTIAPGCRLGWITAQPEIITLLERITDTSTQQPSGFVQSVVSELIIGSQSEALSRFQSLSRKEKASFTGWNMDGWIRWLEGLRGVYQRRMVTMASTLDKGSFQLKQSTPVRQSDADWGVITKTRILSFDWPRAGMFLWLRVHYENHPLWQAKGNALSHLDGPTMAVASFVFLTRKPHVVCVAPGTLFSATPEIQAEDAWAFFRLCFAAEDEENLLPCCHRLVDGLLAFWKIKDVKTIEELYQSFYEEDVNTKEREMGQLGLAMGC